MYTVVFLGHYTVAHLEGTVHFGGIPAQPGGIVHIVVVGLPDYIVACRGIVAARHGCCIAAAHTVVAGRIVAVVVGPGRMLAGFLLLSPHDLLQEAGKLKITFK